MILSHHDYDETPSDEILEALVGEMFKGGADIAKIATTAQRIEDSARMLALPGKSSGRQQDESLKPIYLTPVRPCGCLYYLSCIFCLLYLPSRCVGVVLFRSHHCLTLISKQGLKF